jgi:ABC-type dipeptide/oligopeptide/nickel transport system permease subunit
LQAQLSNQDPNSSVGNDVKSANKKTKGNTFFDWKTFRQNRLGMLSLFVIVFFVLLAVFAHWIMPHDPLSQDILNKFQGISKEHWLGTDLNGRDVLSRIIFGTRISLIVAFCTVLLGATVGFAVGIIAGYKGGLVDDILMRIMDAIMTFPLILFALMLLMVLGNGVTTLVIIISIGMIPGCARIARGATLDIKDSEFVKAALSMGSSHLRIVLTHILPNILASLLVVLTMNMSLVIMVEAGLSFLGVGISPPTPTWGNMIRDGFTYITTKPSLALYPGIALTILVIALNLFGDALRDSVDPHIKRQKK